MITILDITEIFDLLEDKFFCECFCEWWDYSTIGITQKAISNYSFEEFVNEVGNFLDTLDNSFDKEWDSFLEENDTAIFTDEENSIKIEIY